MTESQTIAKLKLIENGVVIGDAKLMAFYIARWRQLGVPAAVCDRPLFTQWQEQITAAGLWYGGGPITDPEMLIEAS